jgi:hypothetical protein
MNKMNKKGALWLWISIILIALLVIVTFLYFALFNVNNESVYAGMQIINPVEGLDDKQALALFDESFVFYLLYEIKAYNLHNPPLSSDYPKIQINVGEQIFNADIKKGLINVAKDEIEDEDVVIRTSAEEAVKMLRDKNYVTKSFNDGKSEIELVASKTTLFAKGYLNLYNEITGKSITGNLIRIYTD